MLTSGISSLSFAFIPFLWKCPPHLSHRFYIMSVASMLNHTTYDFFMFNPQYKWSKRIIEMLDGMAILYLCPISGFNSSSGIEFVLFYLCSKLMCDIELIKKIFFIRHCAILSYQNPCTIVLLFLGSIGYMNYNKNQIWTLQNRLFWHINMALFLGFSIKND